MSFNVLANIDKLEKIFNIQTKICLLQRGFTNPAPKTESARSALSSFTCTLCNKSYSRHPEYEAHIGSYDHQHRKRLQDLKQLSRDPNAAERARRAEKKADAEAGLKKLDSTAGGSSNNIVNSNNNNDNNNAAAVSSKTGGGGFKKGGFKSSFTAVKGAATTAPPGGRKNVLGDDEDEDAESGEADKKNTPATTAVSGGAAHRTADAESDTDDDYGYQNDGDGAYYDPAKPTGCDASCPSLVSA